MICKRYYSHLGIEILRVESIERKINQRSHILGKLEKGKAEKTKLWKIGFHLARFVDLGFCWVIVELYLRRKGAKTATSLKEIICELRNDLREFSMCARMNYLLRCSLCEQSKRTMRPLKPVGYLHLGF